LSVVILGRVTTWCVEVSVKLLTLEPRSAQTLAFLSGEKGKVPPGTFVKRSINFCLGIPLEKAQNHIYVSNSSVQVSGAVLRAIACYWMLRTVEKSNELCLPISCLDIDIVTFKY